MNSWSDLVCDHYPPLDIFDGSRIITTAEIHRFARIILTEGIPNAFSKTPMVFEFARERVAEALKIHPKHISLTGSARIGYSLNPKKFGRPFNHNKSDVDLFIINDDLFSKLSSEYQDFLLKFDLGHTIPRSDRERSFWNSNREFCPNNIRRGFIDQKYIPTFPDFPNSQSVGNAAYIFSSNIQRILNIENQIKCSIRIYKDWESAISQIATSLRSTLSKIDKMANP